MTTLVTEGADTSVDPSTGEHRGQVAHTAPPAVAGILRAAQAAAVRLAATTPKTRATWLNTIGVSLTINREELVQIAGEETGLGADRLRGELTRAVTSLRFYGDVAVEGSYLDASIETVTPGNTLSRWNVPLGPVAVFGASNFPFGFGMIGHDVASALSAGCPVVAKAHPAHPRLSLRLGELASEALAEAGAPAGTYGYVAGFDAGLQLIDAPEIMAVAFTGSQAGGMAIQRRAAARGIPVFAEMGTVNPVFVTPAAARERAAEIAAGFTASFTLGAGQFCTKPGLLFAPTGSGILAAVRRDAARVAASPLLTAGIAEGYRSGVNELTAAAHAAPHAMIGTGHSVEPRIFSVLLDDLQPGSRLLEECFGPVALICEYDEVDRALDAVARLQPALAASVFTAETADADANAAVVRLLPQVGRVALNAWPTGVATSWSQQHGGPWPATSRPESTSVGAGALGRFVRPVALQNAPRELLPPALQAGNPWRVPRRLEGILTLPIPAP
ncbi:aldehyde dehydrogenase [Cryobacterium roopkundense]|uniref:Aldehyde dehydrogenase n=1 Tax=Cryobacterium roopkundense TaxID=1001240 RepID=A0A099J356_9MICO|nr:aldehyde dehydrogenase family protein [Cryobacterium roopkundense]KGJ72869.1 aldehyde dehydrogenase [Cryobacterium roopkundense]MBB5643136.1 NADP-dependent aldehyde dehydrogenase [Cryobacterium roopkundense]